MFEDFDDREFRPFEGSAVKEKIDGLAKQVIAKFPDETPCRIHVNPLSTTFCESTNRVTDSKFKRSFVSQFLGREMTIESCDLDVVPQNNQDGASYPRKVRCKIEYSSSFFLSEASFRGDTNFRLSVSRTWLDHTYPGCIMLSKKRENIYPAMRETEGTHQFSIFNWGAKWIPDGAGSKIESPNEDSILQTQEIVFLIYEDGRIKVNSNFHRPIKLMSWDFCDFHDQKDLLADQLSLNLKNPMLRVPNVFWSHDIFFSVDDLYSRAGLEIRGSYQPLLQSSLCHDFDELDLPMDVLKAVHYKDTLGLHQSYESFSTSPFSLRNTTLPEELINFKRESGRRCAEGDKDKPVIDFIKSLHEVFQNSIVLCECDYGLAGREICRGQEWVVCHPDPVSNHPYWDNPYQTKFMPNAIERFGHIISWYFKAPRADGDPDLLRYAWDSQLGFVIVRFTEKKGYWVESFFQPCAHGVDSRAE